jgi:DNA replication protein DnaC
MVVHETINKLKAMNLQGFVDVLEQMRGTTEFDLLSFEDRIGLMTDREFARRQNNRIQRLIQLAKFQNTHACMEDISYSADRKLDRQLLLELATGNYIQKAQNVNIFGPTGAGKSYLGQALGNAACRQGISTRYIQLTELLDQFRIAEARGIEKVTKLRKDYTNIKLLIIDEWLLFRISEDDCKLLLQLIDRRHNRHSTIIISQFSPDEWIEQMPIQVAAEAITDRLTAKARTIVIEGKESMRLKE